MNLPFLRQRLARILTRPPELLYAFTRSWPLILLLVAAGAVVRWADVTSEPIVYEGSARLIVTPADPTARNARAAISSVSTLRADQVKRFLSAQASILSSESLIRDALLRVGGPGMARPEKPREEAFLSSAIATLRDVRRQVADALRLSPPEVEPDGTDMRLQKAVRGLQRASLATPEPETHSVLLQLYGRDRRVLHELLEAWIGAYEDRLEQASRGDWEDVVSERSRAYRELVASAERALEDFKEKNPDVSDAKLDDLTQQMARHRILRDDLWRELELERTSASGDAASSPASPRESELEQLEAELRRKRREGLPEDSRAAQRLREAIALLEAEEDTQGGEGPSVEERRRALEEKYQALAEKLEALYVAHRGLSEKLKKLHRLEDDHEKALGELQQVQSFAIVEPRQTILVQRADGPAVSLEPFDYRPVKKVAFGAFAGLALGLGLSILLETLSGKVRFKHDVQDDFRLPVVAVFPR